MVAELHYDDQHALFNERVLVGYDVWVIELSEQVGLNDRVKIRNNRNNTMHLKHRSTDILTSRCAPSCSFSLN